MVIATVRADIVARNFNRASGRIVYLRMTSAERKRARDDRKAGWRGGPLPDNAGSAVRPEGAVHRGVAGRRRSSK